MNRRILIMRHATPENPTGVLYGNLPGFPLSSKGQEQAAQAGAVLADIAIDHIISSPLERAHETAQIVANLHPQHPPITLDPRFHDVEFGELEGKVTIDQIDGQAGTYWQQRQAGLYHGELPTATQLRIRQAFDDQLNQHPDTNLLFVFHADPIAFLFQSLLGQDQKPSALYDKKISKASVWEVTLEPVLAVTQIFKP